MGKRGFWGLLPFGFEVFEEVFPGFGFVGVGSEVFEDGFDVLGGEIALDGLCEVFEVGVEVGGGGVCQASVDGKITGEGMGSVAAVSAGGVIILVHVELALKVDGVVAFGVEFDGVEVFVDVFGYAWVVEGIGIEHFTGAAPVGVHIYEDGFLLFFLEFFDIGKFEPLYFGLGLCQEGKGKGDQKR
jgi:hypothetical protein